MIIDKITDLTLRGKLEWNNITGDLHFAQLNSFVLNLTEDGILKAHNGTTTFLEEALSSAHPLVAHLSGATLKQELLTALEALDEPAWKPASQYQCDGDVLELRLTINQELTEEEVDLVTGAVGYAQREYIRSEGIYADSPEIVDGKTLIVMSCDLTKSRRSDISEAFPDFFTAVDDYVRNGKLHKKSGEWLGLFGCKVKLEVR